MVPECSGGFSPPSHTMAKYWQRQERSQSSLFQWNGDMLTGRVSMPIAERTSASALTSVNFCAVSHVWEAMQHPDPWGFQLAQIRREVQGKRIGNGLTWVFLDYVSLFQFRRTPEEDGWFYKALDGMHILYSHEAVEVTLLVDLTPEHLKSAREVWAFCEADSLVVLMSIATVALKCNTAPPTWMVPGWEAVGTSARIASRRLRSIESPSLPPIHAGVALYPPESWDGKGESKRNMKAFEFSILL